MAYTKILLYGVLAGIALNMVSGRPTSGNIGQLPDDSGASENSRPYRCRYSNWTEWTPRSFTRYNGENGIYCQSGKGIIYERTRRLETTLDPFSICDRQLRVRNTTCLPSTSEQIQLLQIALGGRFEGEDLPPPAAPERSQQPQPQAGVRRPHVPVQPQFSSLQRGGGGRIHYPSFNFLLFGTSFTNIRQPTRRIQLARSPSYRQACPRRPTARTTATTTATTRVPPSPSGAWQIVMERMGPGPERSPAPVANSDTRARPDSARGNPRDIALVLDASGSIGSANYKRAVENVATLMGMLCYQWPELDEPSDVRLALVVYSSHVQTVFDFAMSREMHTNSSAIRDSILKARGSWPCMGASTATGPALRRCYDEIFTEENGMRRDSKKRILLITDGMSNRGEPPVPIATQLHHQREVDVFPVGVGTNVNLREMNGMKLFHDKDSLLSKLLILPDFSSLDSVVDEVRTTARNKGRCQANLVR